MTGFGLKLWDDLSFGAIWMNAAMDPNHPEAEKAKKLHSFAAGAMAQAVRLNLALGPQLTELASAVALNEDAMKRCARPCPRRARSSRPMSMPIRRRQTWTCRSRERPSACSVPSATSTSSILAMRAIPCAAARCWGSSTTVCRRSTAAVPAASAIPMPTQHRSRPISASCVRACSRRRWPSPISTARSATTPASCC